MKKITIKFLSISLALCALLLSSCDSDEKTTLNLHFHPKVGAEDFNFNQTYTINDTLPVQFTLAQFYTHGFSLSDDDGGSESIDNYFLVKAGHGTYEWGETSLLHAHELTFSVGVDATNNAQTEANFTARDAEDPLAIQDPKMHWNWNSGYIFAKIEGLVDVDGDGTPETPFAYHIGRNEMLRNLTLMTHQELTKSTEEIMIKVDYANLFKDIDLKNNTTVHGMSATMMDNLKDAFSVM